MKMDRRWFLGIALVACVLLLGIPVSAYDHPYHYNETGSQCGTNLGRGFVNATKLGDAYVGDVLPVYTTQEDTCAAFGHSVGDSHLTNWMRGCRDQDVVILSPAVYLLTPDATWGSVPTHTVVDADRGYPVYLYAYCDGGNNAADVAGYYQVKWGARPGPTPTPTPTPEPTPPIGDVRTTFTVKSATTGYTIHGPNIMLYDTYRAVWKNSTSDADGVLYIDTLPYTDIDAYVTYTIFENEFADAQLLGASAGSTGGNYDILMYPISSPPPLGYVNLFVSTMDGDGDVLRNVNLLAVWGGIQHTGDSGLYGTMNWVVPNNTQVHLIAWKTGYEGAEETINTGAGTSYSTILYLNEQSVTSTPTTTTTQTVIPTVVVPTGSGYANAQGQNMLNWLAANGMSLVQLCFMVTVLALLGVRFGK